MTSFIRRPLIPTLAATLALCAAACALSSGGTAIGDGPATSSVTSVGSSTGSGGATVTGAGGGAVTGSGGNSWGGGGSAFGGGPATGGGLGSGGGIVALPVALGMAGDYAILTKTGITDVPSFAITGNLGVSPGPLSYITGFTMTPYVTNEYSTSPEVTGKIYASDHAVPTPSNLSIAVLDMEAAYADAAARAPDFVELGAGNIGGKALVPGVYSWTSGLLIPTSVTLTGSATDVWIFQVAQDVTVSSAVTVFLTGGAQPKNVFWQVAGKVVLDTTAHFEGVVLSKTKVTLSTGASVKGRLLAQTAVTLDKNTIVEPAP